MFPSGIMNYSKYFIYSGNHNPETLSIWSGTFQWKSNHNNDNTENAIHKEEMRIEAFK